MSSASILARASIFMGAVMLAPGAHAEQLPQVNFTHKDWVIACDNTRTCRAAGYHHGDDEMPVSVLLTRKAGPNQQVTGQIKIGVRDEDAQKMPRKFEVSMRINGSFAGKVVIDQRSLADDLSASQVGALLAAMTRKSTIEWTAGKNTWRLSGQGAAAVLLKMDEFQGRLGTKGALVKKGTLGEESVLPPLPAPVVNVPTLDPPKPGDKELGKDAALEEGMRATMDESVCQNAYAQHITRLTGGKLLVSTPCWSGAYYQGQGLWVINETAPYSPVLVADSATDFSEGKIEFYSANSEGDCRSTAESDWNGKEFVPTSSSSTGLCKSVPGGGWSLPTLVTEVRRAPR